MGLKFERSDDLDKLFDAFAVDPNKKVEKNDALEKFLKLENEVKEKKEDQA